MYLKFGAEQSALTPDEAWAVTRVRLAQKYGWTFDYIDNSLTQDDLLQMNAVAEADAKSKPQKQNGLV